MSMPVEWCARIGWLPWRRGEGSPKTPFFIFSSIVELTRCPRPIGRSINLDSLDFHLMIIEFMKMQRAGSPELPFDGPPFYPPMPLYPQPEDSGIDSDDTSTDNQAEPDNENEDNVSDSSSSDENPVQRSPGVRYLRVTNGDNVIEAVRLNPGGRNCRFPLVLPPRFQPRRKDGYRPVNQSPDRSGSPLYEVELTASDEDDDASLLELVIPAPPTRYIQLPPITKIVFEPRAQLSNLLCCFRR